VIERDLYDFSKEAYMTSQKRPISLFKRDLPAFWKRSIFLADSYADQSGVVNKRDSTYSSKETYIAFQKIPLCFSKETYIAPRKSPIILATYTVMKRDPDLCSN